jgi:hypothetical protein
MWPINGMYQCPKCLRRYPVPWEQKHGNPQIEHARLLTTGEVAKLSRRPAVELTAAPPAA